MRPQANAGHIGSSSNDGLGTKFWAHNNDDPESRQIRSRVARMVDELYILRLPRLPVGWFFIHPDIILMNCRHLMVKVSVLL